MASDELRAVLSPLLSLEEPAIWITKNSYVRLRFNSTADSRLEQQFWLSLTDDTDGLHDLSIHASILEEAIICLDFLVGQQDTHFKKIWLSCKGYRIRLAPFGANTLENILQNSARRICFNRMIFTPDLCRILASSGTKTNIEFCGCGFQDDGDAFVEASAARQDETSGPAKLRFVRSNPFNDGNWALFLSQHKLESLYLYRMKLNSEVSCRAVATVLVQCLELKECDRLEDGGVALVESVRQGLGPKGLRFRGNIFDSSERLYTFMNALRGNTYLERLELSFQFHRQDHQALAAALHENKGLVHFAFRDCKMNAFNMNTWNDLLESISMHPSLCSLEMRAWRRGLSAKKRREVTKAVANMLLKNPRIDAFPFNDSFDLTLWNTLVVPRLECNLYRKRCVPLQQIELRSTRAAVVVRALAVVASNPSLLYMLLYQNWDVVLNYLVLTRDDSVSIPTSRKRSRSSKPIE
jgi:hypothetical protein